MSQARASLERLSRLGIRPNRELGQNFLVDDNILAVIGRTAELRDEDVVLEIGGGLGVLSAYLAPRVRHLHVVETDASLEPALSEALEGEPHANVVIADVMDLALGELEPAPSKVVANLPFGVAVPAILKTIEELPTVTFWCVMVQREIADRLASKPGSKTYGIPSVLVQLAADVKLARAIPRTVFRPMPNVDSALIVLRRTATAPPPAVRAVVQAGFAHRRKALARSLALTTGSPDVRARATKALEEMGHPPRERAERLRPEEFVELEARLR